MPPKKISTDATPSKSLLNFFDRSPATEGSTSTAQNTARTAKTPRKTSETKPLKRAKSGSKAIGNKGTSNAPLVISDDDEAPLHLANVADPVQQSNVKDIKVETFAATFRDSVIDISDDDMGEDIASKSLFSAPAPRPVAASKARTSSKGAGTVPQSLGQGHTDVSPDLTSDSVLIPNGILSSLHNADISSDNKTSLPAEDEYAHAEGSTLVVDLSQKSNLEQALEEEEGEWNEGDEEGMGMEDLDIGDDEDVMADGMDTPAIEEELPQEPIEGGEKRKRKGKQKAVLPRDCSPEIIAIDESDGGDDDSLGGREEVDDFDVDDDECPICGRTFVGMRGDQKRSHVTKCKASISGGQIAKNGNGTTSKPNSKQQPISTFCKPGQPFSIKSERQKKADEERERGAAEVKNLKGPNAFKVLMGGNKEDEEWKVAELDLKRDGKRSVGRRKAPFYKVMTGMPIAVDAFRYGSIPGIKAYFLTHAHSDHYTNLSGSWKHGPIYCSETTANLIQLMLGVDAQWVHGLPWDTPYELPHTGGVMVTVIKANHCPGSSLFLFEGKQTINAGDSTIKSPYVGGKRIWRYLHCGDFRACPEMVLHPAIKDKKLDVVYLDTTYLNPQYCFPPQPLVIAACANLARRTVLGIGPMDTKEDVKMENGEEPDVKPYLEGQIDADKQEKGKRLMKDWLVKQEEEVKAENSDGAPVEQKKRGRTLVIMGTYSIGKERIVKGVARALNSKIYCDARKRGILMCQKDPELHAMLTTDPLEATIHLVPLQTIQLDRLQPYLHKLKDHFSRILAFRPTGWTYSPPAGTNMIPDINMVIRRDQKRTFTDDYLRPMRGSSHQFMIFGVPYSEHSSFFELTCFALSVPGPDVKMIATVNVGSEKSRGKMKKWFEKWQAEKMKRQQAGLPAIVEYRDVTYW